MDLKTKFNFSEISRGVHPPTNIPMLARPFFGFVLVVPVQDRSSIVYSNDFNDRLAEHCYVLEL